MTATLCLTAVIAFLAGRWSKRPGATGPWMRSRYGRDFSGYPEMRK